MENKINKTVDTITSTPASVATKHPSWRVIAGVVACVICAIAAVTWGVTKASAAEGYMIGNGSATADEIIAKGETYFGRSYASMDCAQFVGAVFNSFNSNFPTYYTGNIVNYGESVNAEKYRGTTKEGLLNNVEKGDVLIMFLGSYNSGSSVHALIWAGDNSIIHSIHYGSYDGPFRQNFDEFWRANVEGAYATKVYDRYIIYRGVPSKGGINLHKASSNPSISDDNNCYGDFSGVTYDIYDDSGNLVWTLVTDANGDASTGEKALPKGWYHIKERAGTAPKGYSYSTETTDVEVKAGEMVAANVYDTPQNDPVNVLIKKNSKDGERISGSEVEKQSQGAATYKGAQFTVYYYDTTDAYSLSKDHDTRVAAAKRTWVYETNSKGYVSIQDMNPISGDATYKSRDGSRNVFPIGTYVIEETQAPAGFMAPSYNDRTFIEVVYPIENSTDEYIETYHKVFYTPTGKTTSTTEYGSLGWNAWYLPGESQK